MSDPKLKLERKAKKLVKNEYVIWLTTVDAAGAPQPRPVWFVWDNDSFLIFSRPKAFKIQHIKQNDRVSIHFNTDETGDTDVIVYIGRAYLDREALPAHKVPAYLRKYRKGMKGLGMTPEKYGTDYSVALRIKPSSLRGW